MKALNFKSAWQAISLGIIAGMRSASAPAIAVHLLNHHQSNAVANSKLSFIQSDGFATVLKVMAVGEFIGDKLPFVPARTEITGVVARGISGAFSGAAVSKLNKRNVLTGVVLGSAAAIAATYACYYLRRDIGKKYNIYDPLIGAVEDGLVIAGGLALIKTA